MAKVKHGQNGLARKLTNALAAGLKSAGIQADIDTEPVRLTHLLRVYVVAKNFQEMRPSERQDLVWRIVDQALTPEEQLRISMILTLTPNELKGNWQAIPA